LSEQRIDRFVRWHRYAAAAHFLSLILVEIAGFYSGLSESFPELVRLIQLILFFQTTFWMFASFGMKRRRVFRGIKLTHLTSISALLLMIVCTATWSDLVSQIIITPINAVGIYALLCLGFCRGTFPAPEQLKIHTSSNDGCIHLKRMMNIHLVALSLLISGSAAWWFQGVNLPSNTFHMMLVATPLVGLFLSALSAIKIRRHNVLSHSLLALHKCSLALIIFGIMALLLTQGFATPTLQKSAYALAILTTIEWMFIDKLS